MSSPPHGSVPQPSNAVLSQPHSDESSLYYHRCWWAWCCRSFDSKEDLRDHLFEHAQTAQPERLRDVPAHIAAEDDYWESLDTPSLPLLPSSFQEVSSQQNDDNQGKLLGDVPSSLPSPPASTPQETSSVSFHQQVSADLPTDPGLPVSPSPVLAPSAPWDTHHTPLPKSKFFEAHTSTPTFASLSSQPNSPSGDVSIIPDSPPFSSLVAAATEKSNPARSELPLYSKFSGISEGSSQDSVFQHLTQEMEQEENEVIQDGRPRGATEAVMYHSAASADPPLPARHQIATHSTPQSERKGEPVHGDSEQSSHPQSALQLGSNHERSPPPSSHSPTYSIGIPVGRQSWYQSSYLRRPSRRMPSEPETKLEVDTAAPSSPGSMSADRVAFAVSQDSQPVSQLNHPMTETQDNWTSTDSQTPASYLPLQTQAPYWSQSMSQD